MNLKPLREQVVAVVGASSGIGRQSALQFAQNHAQLIVSARSMAKLAPVVEEIQRLGAEVKPVIADVSVFEQVQAIADTAVSTYGRLDTWVHVPAVGLFAPFDQTPPAEFHRVIEVSLMGQVYGAMAALPHLKREGRGALIHVSSMEGRRALPWQSAYSAAKHGVEGFLEALRVELQHENLPISVTSIKPAVINTPFWENGRTRLGVRPAGIPPYYNPQLVADAIVYTAMHPTRDFLVGDAARILDVLQRLSPGLMDSLLSMIGFSLQCSDQPKAVDDPNNLYQPVLEHTDIHGPYQAAEIPSVLDWVDRNPGIKWGAIATLAALSVLGVKVLNNDGQV